ncbi:MAG: hypothetical protein JKY95_02320 [Planctomycetaceae bacterium]|nr:hypothetical protein [Planctomycetaceae bacterium]
MSTKPTSNLPQFIVTAEGDILGEDTPENQEIVRRIHACVEACEQIPTEDLENGIIQDICNIMGQVVPILEQQKKAS